MAKDATLLSGSLRTGALFGGGFSLAGKDLQDCYSGAVSVATGKRQGQGKYVYPNRAFSYEGGYADGKKTGEGRFTIAGHSYYEGSFENDEIEGVGRQVYDNGSLYEGDFHLGEKHGRGTFTDTVKRERYSGEFRGNARHGRGLLVLEDAGISYEGEFRANKICGQGRLEPPSGVVYEGVFAEDPDSGLGVRFSLTGQGRIVNPDGSYREGEFVKNKLQGEGIRFDSETGVSYRGKFDQDEPSTAARQMSCNFLSRGLPASAAEKAEEAEKVEGEDGEEGGAEEPEAEAEAEAEADAEAEEGDAGVVGEAPAPAASVIENSVLELVEVERESWGNFGLRVFVETEVEVEPEGQEAKAPPQEATEQDGEGEEAEGTTDVDVEATETTPVKEAEEAGKDQEEGQESQGPRTEIRVFSNESGRAVKVAVVPKTAEEEPEVEEQQQVEDTPKPAAEKGAEIEVRTIDGVATVEDLGDLLSGVGKGTFSIEFSSAGLEACSLTLVIA